MMFSFKKSVFTLVFLAITIVVSATNYYISSAGNDAANGLSEATSWKSIAKVNSSFWTFKPGDMILFRRGDVFYGTLNITISGAAGNPITIGAYGTGNAPVISGFTTLTGWTSMGNGIYSKTVATASMPNMVTIDNVNTPLGRTPNLPSINGWPSTIPTGDSYTSTSMTDADLATNSSVTGAEVVIRSTQWTVERKTATQTGNTLTYSATLYTPPKGAGYFIQNHISALDAFGEWCFSNGTIYMYFGLSDNPDNHIIKVSSIDNLINCSKNYININNLTIEGANWYGINLNNADYNTIQNCTIRFGGNYGIYGTACDYDIITSNTIDNNNDYGIYLNYDCTHSTIKSNTISNTGMILGMGSSGDNGYNAVVCQGNYSLITYNTINNTGYDGIRWGGQASEVSYNFINNSCQNKADGAGIYSYRDYNTAKVIKNNIIFNSTAQPYGWSSQDFTSANGIYCDGATNISITNNVIAHVQGKGIFINSDNNIIAENNTLYDNSFGIYIFSDPNANGVDGRARNHTVRYNTLFAKTASQYCMGIVSKNSVSDLSLFGVIDYNYYARPIKIDKYISWTTWTPNWSGGEINLAQFRSLYGYDLNSTISATALTDVNKIRFEYNETNTNKVITLDAGYIDAVGTKYSGTVTLLPFTGLVLMVDPNPSAVPNSPVYTGSSIENSNPSVLTMNYSLTLGNVTPAASAFTVKVNSTVRAVNTVTVSGTRVQLTLASPVVSGDVVTVSYTKPATNPIQTPAGGQAASIADQAVTNNVSGIIAVYTGSSVENATPAVITLSFNNSLAGIVPAASSFTVLVNSVARTVNSVVVSGTTVKLTLSAPIISSDVVTVTYTKPSVNPLQTASGTQVASMAAQPVTNRVAAVAGVISYLGSSIEDATPALLQLDYDLSLNTVPPAVSAFNVTVNSLTMKVQSVAISGKSVLLTLAYEVQYGDIVTVAYTKPSANPLQSTTGLSVATMNSQSVKNKVNPNGPVYLSSSVGNTAPNVLEIVFDEIVETSVPATSSFVVMVNGAKANITSVAITGNTVLLTLAAPVVFGDNVTVSYIKPSSNELKKATGETAVSFSSPQPVTNKCVKTSNNSLTKGITVYPNPARDYINISVLETSVQPQLLKIFDLSGKLFLESQINSGTNTKVLINLKSGIYIVQVVSGSIINFVQKLIVL